MKTRLVLMTFVAALLATLVQGQERWLRWQPRMATADSFDGGFNFCRVMYQSQRFGRGGGWSTDYPRADLNLSIPLVGTHQDPGQPRRHGFAESPRRPADRR